MLLPLLYFEATEAVLLYLVSGVALKVETSRWLSSGKLVAPKEDNIHNGKNLGWIGKSMDVNLQNLKFYVQYREGVWKMMKIKKKSKVYFQIPFR